jgi:hypothetical protein
MAAITTRQTAGTGATVAGVPLTNAQLDTNFINLNTELTGITSSKTANTIYAAPNGSAGAPTFRSLVAADIPTLNQSTTGSAGTLLYEDNRTISPSELTSTRLKFGFTSWNNDNGTPYADFLHLRSYTDASGGNDNLVMFRKDAIGMRIWQQTFGSATAYATFKDIAFTDGTNATGTWSISTTGNAGTVTNGVYTNGSYADPAWITSLAKSKVGLANVENTALSTWAGSTNITTIGAATATSLSVTGNLTVNGTTTTVNSTTVTVDDPILTLGGDTAPTVDDNKDRGIEFRWHNGTAAKVGFFGFDDSTGYLTFIPDATNTSEVFSGTMGDIQATNFRGALIGNASTATTAGNVTGTVAIANGGTGATTNTAARTNLGATTVGSNLFTLTNPTAVTFLRVNADNTVSTLDAATFRTAIGAGTSSTTGTVTSVGGTGTVSGLTLSGTVTSTGNLTLGGTLSVAASNFSSQTANTVLIAPNGAAGVPTFRALVAADIPTLNQNTTGTASNVTGTVAAANGGTGLTSPGTSGNVLTSTGSAWTSSPGMSTGKAIAMAIVFGG